METTIERLRQCAEEVVRQEPAVMAVVLFGSRARGTAGPRSDWDVALIEQGGSAAETAYRLFDPLPGVRPLGIGAEKVANRCGRGAFGGASAAPIGLRWISSFGIQNALNRRWIPASAGMTAIVKVTHLVEMPSFPRKRESISVSESRNLNMEEGRVESCCFVSHGR